MQSKILVVGSYNKTYEEIHKVTLAHNQKYFDKYDIEYIYKKNDVRDDVALNCYDKFEMVTSLLNERDDIDYIWSMDVDIVICDFNIDIRTFTKFSHKDILFSSVYDCHPEMYWNINAGSIIFKNCKDTKRVLKNYMAIGRQFGNDDTLWNDQDLWQHVLKNDHNLRGVCSVFPMNAFNHGNADKCKDLFLVHDMSASSTTSPSHQAAVIKLESIKRIINELR